jgi:hypothetical protein
MHFRKTLLLTVMFIGISALLACGGGGNPSSTSTTNEWYSGGTLHKKTIADWRAATYENRLATCADFVMGLGKYETLPPDLKERATAFEACISDAVAGGSVDHQQVSEIAAVCAVSMGY